MYYPLSAPVWHMTHYLSGSVTFAEIIFDALHKSRGMLYTLTLSTGQLVLIDNSLPASDAIFIETHNARIRHTASQCQ